jgi:methionyl-tRNA formyltransferase
MALKNKMLNINLFTYSVKFAKIIRRFFHIKEIYYEKSKKNRDLLQFCRNYNIKIREVKNLSEVKKNIFNSSDLGIIYGWGIIFNKDYIENYRHGIWNFHPGDLPKYRGRHPISWAFLKNEKKIGITIHKIDERIDRGEFLTRDFVKRNLDDDINDVENKIFLKLPKLIIDALKKIESKKLLKIGKGTYHPSLYNGIEIKNPINYDYRYIYNAVKSQSAFGGLKIGKLNFKKVFPYNKKNLKVLKNFNIINCKNSKKLILVK